MASFPKISLVLSDIDGTLITPQKEITPAARQAIADVRARGIKFAIASSRPARGLAYLADELQLDTPVSGFNGGRIIGPAGEDIATLEIPEPVVREIIGILQGMGVPVWVFAGDDWYVTDPHGHRVEHEIKTIRYNPIVVDDFPAEALGRTVKVVGAHPDHDLIAKAAREIQGMFGQRVSATCSQPFYLDITNVRATKGEVVKQLAAYYGISTGEILTIGDASNDVLMFRESGYSIAMGNATEEVQMEANAVTARNTEDGFAKAMQGLLAGG
jgi:Cof subfamily protein (haloacid dehalogenase superfamily)